MPWLFYFLVAFYYLLALSNRLHLEVCLVSSDFLGLLFILGSDLYFFLALPYLWASALHFLPLLRSISS